MATIEYHGKYKKLFPGVLSSNSFLSVYILHMLSSTTRMYGKEIVDSITERLDGTWEPSHGLVYPILRNLEDMTLIKGIWEDQDKKTKRFYHITDEGRKALLAEVSNIRPMFEDARKMIDTVITDLYTPKGVQAHA